MNAGARRGAAGWVALSLSVIAVSIVAFPAGAASVGIAPVRVTFETGDRSQVVELTNRGSEPVSMQADPRLWLQDPDGNDLYSDTDDLLVVPRIFSIDPGASQIVRIGRVDPGAERQEKSYRVFFTQLAPATTTGPQLQFRLRLAIPVFMMPKDRAAPKLEMMRAGHTEEGFEVVLHNSGTSHIQVLELDAEPLGELSPDATSSIVGGYLLPGTTRRFLLPIPQHVPVISVRAETDVAGTLEYGLALID